MSASARIPAALILSVVLLVGSSPPTNAQPVDFTLTVLHHNDGESQLMSLADPDFGGAARFKTLADQLKADATGPGYGAIMVSSGDSFLPGPEFNVSLDKGVPFYDSIALDLIGYDALCLGNHDFDFGPANLADFIDGFSTTQPPTFLSANLDFSLEPTLQAKVASGDIAPSTVVNVAGESIGIIGATTPNLPFVSSPGRVQANPDVAGAVQAAADAMAVAGVNKVVLISHLQSIEEDLALVPLISGIDIVVGGGGDNLLANPGTLLIPGDAAEGPYPVYANDATSASIPLVTTKGDYGYIGRLRVGFSAAGEVVEVNPASDPVRVSGVAPDAVAEDPAVKAQVTDPLGAALAGMATHVIGVSEADLDGIRAHVRTRETNLGDLVADAELWSATRLAADFGAKAPDVALQSGGGIRNSSVIPAGEITELDTFDVLPFPSFVTIVEAVPPEQLEQAMENAVSKVENVDGRFAQIAGFSVAWTPSGVPQETDVDGTVTRQGSRIWSIRLDDGRWIVRWGAVVPGAPSVTVATIDFLARGGDQYPFKGLPYTSVGVTYQRALQTYIEDALGGAISAADYPAGGEGRIVEFEPPVGGEAVGGIGPAAASEARLVPRSTPLPSMWRLVALLALCVAGVAHRMRHLLSM